MPGDYNIKILHAYIDSQDYSNMEFSEAIRFFLSKFRLPGEAQKIDRLMEKFADRYTKCNPNEFGSADAAYVLGFSVIMLNTDLHNPNIIPEKKMTLEGFIRNCRGINDGNDFPPEFLTTIYNNIKTNPISLKEDDEIRLQYENEETVHKIRQEAFLIVYKLII